MIRDPEKGKKKRLQSVRYIDCLPGYMNYSPV